jgi:hypothetical protein
VDTGAPTTQGRDEEIALVHRQLGRLEPDAGPVPVLVIAGAAGTGKTTLLQALDESCAGVIPRARLDPAAVVAEGGQDPVPVLLAMLARRLSRHCPVYGRLPFERLAVGLLAVAAPLSQDGVNGRRQLEESLSSRRGLNRVEKVLTELAGAAAGAAGVKVPVLTGEIVSWAVRTVAPRLPGRPSALRRALEWYGRTSESAFDELHDLHEAGPETARKRLWQALLADLHAAFERHDKTWTSKVLVLLDNADHPLGRLFLRELVRPPLPAGTPLVLVAASRGPLLPAARNAARTVGTRPRRLTRGSYAVRLLPGLREQDLLAMLGRPPTDEPAANLAQQLLEITGGHPEGAALVMGEHKSPIEPEARFKEIESDLLAVVLRGTAQDETEALGAAARARTEREALGLLRAGGWAHVTLPLGMWNPAPGADLTLARLLLRRTVPSWTAREIHELLAEGAGPADRLYHLLALGRIDEVVSWLSDPMPTEATGARWLRTFDAAVRAPRPPDPGSVTGTGLVSDLVTIAHQVHDPMLRSDRSALYRQMAGAYRGLSRQLRESSDEIADRVEHYELLSRRWRVCNP